MTNGQGKSDGPVVPSKPSNQGGTGGGRPHGNPYTGTKAETPDTAKGEPTGSPTSRRSPAEGAEGRGPAKGNPPGQTTLRTQGRDGVQRALARVRQAAKKDKKRRFTSLLHHVYNPTALREAYFGLKRDAAPGVDGQTWRTFDFLGFTHICAKKRDGRNFTVLRQTMRKRLTAKLAEVKAELKRRLHDPVPEVGRYLRSVVEGHFRYYAVPMNGRALKAFRFHVVRHWHRVLGRRSQRGRVPWERTLRLVAHYLPRVRLYHPYPLRRLGVVT